MKTVDVIIPVHHPDAKFQKILNRLNRQTYQVSRIIVVNTDRESYPAAKITPPANMELYHVQKEDFDHGGTRDMAAHLSEADYLLFMTQDAIPADPYLVERLVGAFEEPGTAAAFARQLPRSTDTRTEQYTRAFNYPAKSRRKFLERDLLALWQEQSRAAKIKAAAARRKLWERRAVMRLLCHIFGAFSIEKTLKNRQICIIM